MRTFSRWMPPLRTDRHPPITVVEWIVFAIIDVGLQAVAGVIVAVVGLCVCVIVGTPGVIVTAGVLLVLALIPPLRLDRHPPMTIVEWIVGPIIHVVLQGVAGVIVAVVGLCVWMIVGTPGIVVTAAVLLLWVALGTWSANRAERAIAEERQSEDIGSFARAIDRRSEPFDPWVVRAVWDAFTPYTGFPLRATDRLEDFGIDLLELDLLFVEIAERSGHSLKNLHDFWLDGATLGDLVTFVSSQPKRPAGS